MAADNGTMSESCLGEDGGTFATCSISGGSCSRRTGWSVLVTFELDWYSCSETFSGRLSECDPLCNRDISAGWCEAGLAGNEFFASVVSTTCSRGRNHFTRFLEVVCGVNGSYVLTELDVRIDERGVEFGRYRYFALLPPASWNNISKGVGRSAGSSDQHERSSALMCGAKNSGTGGRKRRCINARTCAWPRPCHSCWQVSASHSRQPRA
jgi:hypothetical protein